MKRELQWAALLTGTVVAAGGMALVFLAPAVQPGPGAGSRAQPEAAPRRAALEAQPAPDDDAAGSATLRARLEELESARAALTAERDAARRELADARAELSRARAALQATSGDAEPGLRVRFGAHGDVQALRDLDWTDMAQATRTLTDLIADMRAGRVEWNGESGKSFMRQSNRLWGAGIEVSGQVPTLSQGQGEYTHPIVLSNLVAESLDQGGDPLQPAQVDQLEVLGRDYDQALLALEAGYPEGTFALRKLLDELSLKRDFSQRLRDLLSATQSELLTPAATRDVNTLDLYSPVLMLVNVAHTLTLTPDDDLRAKLTSVTPWWGLTPDDQPGLAAVLDAWRAGVEPLLGDPVAPQSAQHFDLDRALRAGEAQLEAMQQVALALPDRADVLETLRATRGFVVPIRVSAGE